MLLLRTIVSLGLLLMLAFTAVAEVSLQQSNVWKRARTLNPGQQAWGLQNSYQKISDRFSHTGRIQPLGQPYSRAVTWRQLLANEATVQERSEMESYMRSSGAGEDEVAATASYKVEREEVGFQVNWAYGLMKRWTIGFDVPLVHRRTKVSSDVEVTPVLAGVRVSSVSQKVHAASERQLANSGYDNIPDRQSSWAWGDASLLSQVALFEGYRWQWSMQQLVRFPTARNPELDSYIQSNDDGGQVDLGVSSLFDYRYRRWVVGGRLGYVMQLPDRVRARVSDSQSSRKVDPKVYRDLGDWYWASADGDYRLSSKWNLNMEYAYLMKFQDNFRGRSAEGVDYATFAKNSDQDLHQTKVGVLYQIGQETTRGGVSSKIVAGLAYNYPWVGHNSLNASRTSIDLITYF